MDLRSALLEVLWDFLGHGDSCGKECEDETAELVDSIMAALGSDATKASS